MLRASASYSAADLRHMKRCLDLASRGAGKVSPNPMVGCVIVRDGRVIAEGYHRRFGGAHAEMDAARSIATGTLRGCTVYVNLEPCSHHGKTPPCAVMLARMGVQRVVCSLRDPNPCVNGRGIAILRRSGIRVDVGLLAREAAELNRRYLVWVRTGRPFVTLKAAVTLDGKTATATGVSRWVTSERARSHARRMRALHDAVIIGMDTANTDNPLLTVPGGRHGPMRVVIGSLQHLRPGLRLCSPDGPSTMIASPMISRATLRRLSRGCRGTMVAVFRGKTVPPGRLLALLSDLGVSSVFVEGGGETAWHFVQAGLVDEILLYVAPKILGGSRAKTFVGGKGFRSLACTLPLTITSTQPIGHDVLIVARPVRRRMDGATTARVRSTHVHRSH